MVFEKVAYLAQSLLKGTLSINLNSHWEADFLLVFPGRNGDRGGRLNHCWMVYKLLIVLLLVTSVDVSAQNDIPIGTWRSHFSYYNAKTLALANEKVYCGTENGLFFFDKNENTTTILSKVNGLSDVGISSLAYLTAKDLLFIAYANGNIDLLQNNEITNVKTIKTADFSTSKRINHIGADNYFAYLSTDFGVVVFDLEKKEIKESYKEIGENATVLQILSSTIVRDSLFVATDKGVLATSLDPQVNRLDFQNWRRFDAITGIPKVAISAISARNEVVYATIDNDSIYRYDGHTWKAIHKVDGTVNSMTQSGAAIFISLSSQLLKLDRSDNLSQINESIIEQPFFAMTDMNSHLWVADGTNGLVTNVNNAFESIRPNGLFFDAVWRLRSFDKKLVALAGGYTNGVPHRNENGFSVFENGQWKNYNSTGISDVTAIPEVKDLVDVAYDSFTGKIYFASFGYGIIAWDGEETFFISDENTAGSTLQNTNAPEHFTKVSSVAFDFEGNLWMLNHGTTFPLQVLNTDGTWQAFPPSSVNAKSTGKLLIPDAQHKWLMSDNGTGIIVFDEENNETRSITSGFENGRLPNNRINDVVEDNNGEIWIGTKLGVVFFPTSFSIINEESLVANVPFFDNRPLLSKEDISAIEVDGGNRKWIGTSNGLWLFGEAGESLVFKFTAENSPLPSNKIIDLEIEGTTGELFIATDKGMVSFRSTATMGTPMHQSVKIFPNPVKSNFNGTVGISGLANNALVKITDISGKLIFEIRAQGGTATWNARGYNGQRASTGVYLVFSATANGEETFVGKIAVVN